MEYRLAYEERPWLKCYPAGVPADIEIPLKSINQLFDEATEKWKNKTALIFSGKKISYQELRKKADKFATGLFHLGIKKGDRVALLMLNSPEYVIAFFGTLKAGAIITSINPVYVSSEIKYQMEDSGAETIICHDMLYNSVDKTGIKLRNVILTNITESLSWTKSLLKGAVLRKVYGKMGLKSAAIYKREGFYRMQELINKYPPSPPKIKINPKEDIMTLSYTAGTTGQPKGIMTTHYNTIAIITSFLNFYSFLKEGKEICIGYIPHYHITGQVYAMQLGIFQGYTQVILTTSYIDEILRAVVVYKPTFFVGVPAIYETLKDYEKTDRVNWKNLKMVMSSGDTLREATKRGWKFRTGVSVTELYGMTEMGLTHMCPLGEEKIGTIGIPAPNIIAGIVDLNKNEFLPVGEIGEIAVKSPTVMKGEWNKSEAGNDVLIEIDGEIWYRTGDLGKMDEKGYFYFYDRKHDLIKYRELHVYAREVEEVLKTHPEIKEVGVIGVLDSKVGQNVKALVVLEADARGKLSEAEIIEYCKGKLDHHKIPKLVEFVSEIPKTDVGKVSRRELRDEVGLK